MKKEFFFIVTLLISAYSCTKDSAPFFNGIVDRQINGCSGSTGFVFIIKYTNQNGSEDSLSTLTLPTQYKLPATKIKFQMKDLISTDEPMFCNAMIIAPKQKMIFNVKTQ